MSFAKIGDVSVNKAFYHRLINKQKFVFYDMVSKAKVREEELEEIAAKLAFQWQTEIKKNVSKMPNRLQKKLKDYYLVCKPEWWDYDAKNCAYKICYSVICVDEEQYKEIKKQGGK